MLHEIQSRLGSHDFLPIGKLMADPPESVGRR